VTCNEEKQQEIISPSAACNVVKKIQFAKNVNSFFRKSVFKHLVKRLTT
jgi:hypothetical protein